MCGGGWVGVQKTNQIHIKFGLQPETVFKKETPAQMVT